MSDLSTDITYERVRTGAQTMQECARNMDNIFQDFSSSMNRVGADDVSIGEHRDTLRARYDSLKTKFDDYVNLVNQFANMILGAASQTEHTEKKLADAANTLAG